MLIRRENIKLVRESLIQMYTLLKALDHDISDLISILKHESNNTDKNFEDHKKHSRETITSIIKNVNSLNKRIHELFPKYGYLPLSLKKTSKITDLEGLQIVVRRKIKITDETLLVLSKILEH